MDIRDTEYTADTPAHPPGECPVSACPQCMRPALLADYAGLFGPPGLTYHARELCSRCRSRRMQRVRAAQSVGCRRTVVDVEMCSAGLVVTMVCGHAVRVPVGFRVRDAVMCRRCWAERRS